MQGNGGHADRSNRKSGPSLVELGLSFARKLASPGKTCFLLRAFDPAYLEK